MKFSVLIPVYNVEKYIDECLLSLINQTYHDFEVILVDDGSTDSSGAICDRYASEDERIKVIHQKNQGLISARRVAIAEAKGEYCVFLDSDDAVKTELLSVLNDSIYESRADIVLYSFLYYDGKETKKRNKKLFESGRTFEGESKKELYERFLFTTDFNAIWSKCIKTELLKDDSTDYTQYYSFNMGEDSLQSLYPLTAAERILFIDEELYLYRLNSESISKNMNLDGIYKKNERHLFSLMKDYLSLWKLGDDEHIKKLDAANFAGVMYTFSEYYKAADSSDRKRVVDFDWDSFMCDDFRINGFCNETYVKIYNFIKNKQYNKIYNHFCIQNIYGKYKKIKGKFK